MLHVHPEWPGSWLNLIGLLASAPPVPTLLVWLVIAGADSTDADGTDDAGTDAAGLAGCRWSSGCYFTGYIVL